MAIYQNLLDTIANNITTNGNNEITGTIMKSVLQSMVNVMGANATYGGVAHPADNVGTPDGAVVYVASEAGTYTNFGGITLASCELAILKWDTSSWTKESITYVADIQEIYDAEQDALDAIALAIQGLNIYYDIVSTELTKHNVQLKDGSSNSLLPITEITNIAGLNTLATFVDDGDGTECGLLLNLSTITITLTGTLQDTNSNVIANATITIGQWSTTTDANGAFSIVLPIGTWDVSCQNYYDTSIVVFKSDSQTITMTELPTYAVTIHLVGETYGDAMENVTITCDSGETATTNEYGVASFASIHEGEHTFTANNRTRTFNVWNSPSMTRKCMECDGDDIYESTDVVLSGNSEDSELDCYNPELYAVMVAKISALASDDQRITLAQAQARTDTISLQNATTIVDGSHLKFFNGLKFTAASALRGLTNCTKLVISGRFGNGSSSSLLMYNCGTITYFSLWKAKVYGSAYAQSPIFQSTTFTHFVVNPNMPYLKCLQDWGSRIDLDDVVTSTALTSMRAYYTPAPSKVVFGEGFNTSKVTTMQALFTNATALVEIKILGELDMSLCTNYTGWLGTSSGYGSSKLTTVSTGFKNICANISFGYASKLTKASIANIISGLKVYEANSATHTITFHSTAKATYGATDLANDLAAIGWALA